MYKLSKAFASATFISKKHNHLLRCLRLHESKTRNVSALYITGDKARENYVTLQPYMDFSGTFENTELLETSIGKRKMEIDLKQVQQMFEKYRTAVREIENVEKEREVVAKQLKEMAKAEKKDERLSNQMKERGKLLRNKVKLLKTDLYPLEDEFMQSYLHLPNLLHPHCPHENAERILYQSGQPDLHGSSKSHLDNDTLISFIDNSRYYLMKEAAEFDLQATDVLRKYFLQKGNFIQTCNPDFVRCVLLEAQSTPLVHYHKVMEEHLQNKLNSAYLTGGASFESFLGAVTKLCVYPTVIPLKYVSSGRLYEQYLEDIKPSLYTATQTNAVQTFVATKDFQQSIEQMDDILNLCVDFYKSFTKLHFRIVYVTAAELTPSESLRAQIEVYSPFEKRYICVGRVSNYTDYVSKRILFTMRDQKDYKFLHLVGGPILYTTRLIAALMEMEEPLDCTNVSKLLKTNQISSNKSMDDFKSLFK